jgi:hypothetical protein
MKSYWKLHKEQQVFISNFSNMGTDAASVSRECDAIKIALANESPKSILAIVDLNETFVNDGIILAFRQLLPITNKYVKRRAIIGLSGFRRHFIFTVAKFVGDVNFSPFDTMDEALEWITKN